MKIIFKIITFTLLLLSISLAGKSQLVQPVKWSYAAKRINKQQAILYIKATIENGWHINSIQQLDGGPLKTSIIFVPDKAYNLVGKLTEPKPLSKYEEVFGMNVLYFQERVVFTQKISLRHTQAVIKGKIGFMACTNDKCLPPAEVPFDIIVK